MSTGVGRVSTAMVVSIEVMFGWGRLSQIVFDSQLKKTGEWVCGRRCGRGTVTFKVRSFLRVCVR